MSKKNKGRNPSRRPAPTLLPPKIVIWSVLGGCVRKVAYRQPSGHYQWKMWALWFIPIARG